MSRLRPGSVVPFAVTITIATLMGCSSPPPISVSLSPSSPQALDQGQSVAITANVANDTSADGVMWSLSGPGSLTSNAGTSVTYISPSGNITAAQQAMVTATSMKDATKHASVQITVDPSPYIPFQTLASGSVGSPYSQMITLTGGTAPFQWSVYDGPIETGWEVGGAVPDGLQLNSTTGVISGTPTGGGTWYFEATVTDAAGVTIAQPFLSIQINSSAPPGSPVPFLNQPLAPAAVSPGSPGFLLTVSGTGFASGASLDFNNVGISTTFLDSEHLTAMIPAGLVATAGTAPVSVLTLGGYSNVVYFQIGASEENVSFANAPNSPLQVQEPVGIIAADFNGDGKPDLAVAGNVKIYVLLGNGNGTFAPASGSPLPVPSPPYNDLASPYTGPAIAAGDFNHSGHLGLAVGEFSNQAIVILLGHGDGTFVTSSAAFANALGAPTSGLGVADFNADGTLDLAIANQISGQSPVVLGYGKGAFNAAGDLYTMGFPAGVAVGDFNADGKLDVAVAGGGSTAYPDSGLSVSLGNGDGTFTQASGSPIPLGQNLSAIVASDFNGDGRPDLAVTDSVGNDVMILLGNGDGTFRTPTIIPVGNGPDAIVAGDFNNDGKLDLAIANAGDNTVTLLLGNGDGTFTPASGSPYPVGRGPDQIVAADFNGDGKLDLAVVNSTDNTVSILLQQ